MLIQDLPGYVTDFKTALWKVRESAHYCFHYFQDSVAEREIEHIEQAQENAYAKITEFLGLSAYPENKIGYYLYPDAETKKRLMGSPWFAQSVYDDFAVHALYTEEHRVIGPHEDTHLLSLPLGLSIGFIQEGLAEHMAGMSWHGEPFDDVVREAQKDPGFTISHDLPIAHRAWRETSDAYAQAYYALAALFTGYLIARYGKERYLALYRALHRNAPDEENRDAYESVLGVSAMNIFSACMADLAARAV